MSALLSTLQRLPDAERVAVERSLVPLARRAAIGTLAGDVAHDAGNALFGLTGLLDLILADEPLDAERVALLQGSAAELAVAFRPLLQFARGAYDESGTADLVAAAREAVALYHHGDRKLLTIAEDHPDQRVPVACPAGLLVQAAVHLLLAAAPRDRLDVAIRDGALSVSPAGGDSLDEVVAARIAADHGGGLAREGSALVLRLPSA